MSRTPCQAHSASHVLREVGSTSSALAPVGVAEHDRGTAAAIGLELPEAKIGRLRVGRCTVACPMQVTDIVVTLRS